MECGQSMNLEKKKKNSFLHQCENAKTTNCAGTSVTSSVTF